jgi:hypothetical protein
MRIVELHKAFISAMHTELPDWRFVASRRHFKKSFPNGLWYAHFSFINHARKRACIVGANLGNIEGVGQVRYSVNSPESAVLAASEARDHIDRIGLPFLQKYSDPAEVLRCLRAGGPEARLISPIMQIHEQQIQVLEVLCGAV